MLSVPRLPRRGHLSDSQGWQLDQQYFVTWEGTC